MARPRLGENQLRDLFPELTLQLVDPANGSVNAGSAKNVMWRCAKNHEWLACPKNRSRNSTACPFCEGRRAIVGETDLATTHPELAAQLVDKQLAFTLKAGSSGLKVEWVCDLGHTWMATTAHRTLDKSGCPVCSGTTVLAGFNDLRTTHPTLARDLVDQSLATTMSFGSQKKVEWECQNGHRWVTSIGSRSLGRGCGRCSGQILVPGENDLATTHPKLAAELVDPEIASSLLFQLRWLV